MTFNEKMKELLDHGVAASKEFAAKAGAKAQDLGERGVLMLEIKQLESQAQKLMTRLGGVAFRLFTEQNLDSVGRELPEVRLIMTEIAEVRASIERKETELKNRRN